MEKEIKFILKEKEEVIVRVEKKKLGNGIFGYVNYKNQYYCIFDDDLLQFKIILLLFGWK